LTFADDLRAESSDSTLSEELIVMLLNIDFFLNVFDSLDCDVASLLESVSNLKGVDAFIEELLSLL
jgi:hypothetical protein